MFLFPLNRPIVCPSPLTATSMETSGSGKSPFLISLVVSVDIKHHVYLLSGKTGFRRLPFYVHDLVWLGEVVFMNWFGQVIFMKWFGQVIFSSCLMFRSDHACLNDTQKEKKRRQGTLLPVNNYLFVSAFKPDGETDLL